ncbi:MAG: hypothetical protein JWN15_2664 [Firmicutes bacterium]|nr:hypothetical protein [Bacillota bacterium]
MDGGNRAAGQGSGEGATQPLCPPLDRRGGVALLAFPLSALSDGSLTSDFVIILSGTLLMNHNLSRRTLRRVGQHQRPGPGDLDLRANLKVRNRAGPGLRCLPHRDPG